jgi:hypothetical protein
MTIVLGWWSACSTCYHAPIDSGEKMRRSDICVVDQLSTRRQFLNEPKETLDGK